MMQNMMNYNMANMMAEDAGAFELRSPMTSGMHTADGLISRLFRLICRH